MSDANVQGQPVCRLEVVLYEKLQNFGARLENLLLDIDRKVLNLTEQKRREAVPCLRHGCARRRQIAREDVGKLKGSRRTGGLQAAHVLDPEIPAHLDAVTSAKP